MKRREFLRYTAAAAGLSALAPHTARAEEWGLRIGVTDWDLLGIHYMEHSTPKPEAVGLAKEVGFDGLEINLGRRPDSIPLTNPELQEAFLEASEEHDLPIQSTCLDILHQNYLKSDPLGAQWVREAIPVTANLGAAIVLLPFFGEGGLRTDEEIDHVADILGEIAPEAEDAGIVLGVENTLSARDNARLIERADSEAVRLYYDVGNSHSMGYDIIEEIGWLGADPICQFHIKDNPHYLGEGEIDFEEVFEAIRAIGFNGWGVLETASPSGDATADMVRNLAFVRETLAEI